MNNYIPWSILICPLLSALSILLFLRESGDTSAMMSVGAVGFSFLGALMAFLGPNTYEPSVVPFISLPGFQIPLGVVVDDLSKVMLLVVTGVGLLVHIYSTVYMRDDDAKA